MASDSNKSAEGASASAPVSVDERWSLLPNPGAKKEDPGPAPHFEKGVRAIMELWTALMLAVENEWGGRDSEDKAEDLHDTILDWFYYGKGTVYADELEKMLDEYMKDMFNCDCEDESPKEVARSLVELYHECADGNYSSVVKLVDKAARSQSRQSSVKQKRQKVDEDGGASAQNVVGAEGVERAEGVDGASGMEEDRPRKNEPIIDEDGFEMVTRKGKRR